MGHATDDTIRTPTFVILTARLLNSLDSRNADHAGIATFRLRLIKAEVREGDSRLEIGAGFTGGLLDWTRGTAEHCFCRLSAWAAPLILMTRSSLCLLSTLGNIHGVFVDWYR